MDNFRIYDTMFRFNNKTERPSGGWRRNQKFVHDAYFWKILNMLKDEGFDVHHDESVSKIIRRNYIEGKRRDLKFKAQRFPAIVLGCVELGARLGMFDKKESEEISE